MILSKKTLRGFWESYQGADRPSLEQALKAWYREVKHAEWKSPNEVKQKYRNASVVGNQRIVFNICGNKFRLVVSVSYLAKIVFIKWVGTHSEYDNIDAERV